MQEQLMQRHKESSGFGEVVANQDKTQFLTFELGDEHYGIDILNIKEIVEQGHITRVPMSSPLLAGVINLRGNVVPVVDLAQRFSQDKTARTKKSAIVIVEIRDEDKNLEIGITVDIVDEVLDVFNTEIKSAPSFGTSIRADFIRGIVKLEEQLLVLLDVNQILSIDELSENNINVN